MRRASPEQAGYTEGAPLPAIGRAARWRCGAAEELWRLGGADQGGPAGPEREAVAARLLSLGGAGIGGFIDGGVDAAAEGEGAAAARPDGAPVWLVRRLAGASLSDRMRARRGPFPFEEALRLAIAIGRALAACERASLFPGPLSPDAILVDDAGQVTLPADALVAALVGGQAGRGAAPEPRPEGARVSSAIPPLWTPPAQADGALWDSAANRYALGLVLYRLLAGEHPFAGAGLRHALGEAAHREPPPFVEGVAASLPAGLQGYALRLLHPDPARRPSRAEAIVDTLGGFLEEPPPARATHGARASRRAATSTEDGSAAAPAEARTAAPAEASRTAAAPRGREPGVEARARRPSRGRHERGGAAARLWPLAPVGAGALVAAAALALTRGAPERAAPRTVAVAPVAPLAQQETAAEDCAACHGRQAAEWRRSVMAHSVKSPLFNALESLIEEQVGRDADCPHGAGILRKVDPARACRDRGSGVAVTGSGGEHWCVNCHSPAENLDAAMPAWDGRPGGDPRARLPVRDLLTRRGLEGISCGFCHQVHGPVGPRGRLGYQGNPTWTSFVTGAVFPARPEDARGLLGIANSGYDLRPEELLLTAGQRPDGRAGRPSAGSAGGDDPIVHGRPSASAKAYLRSSEFCGACHDVRLFGTDSLAAARGEHFKRLRNAYTEWSDWARSEERAGRRAATCQDCHMSTYPGVCEAAPASGAAQPPAGDPECPPGTRFSPRPPGSRPRGRVADHSTAPADVATHYFSGVDVPLSDEFPEALVDEPSLDVHGIPASARRRRDLLLRHTFRFDLGAPRRAGAAGERVEIPMEIENIGAGHKVPAGFSQEREIWVHLVVRGGDGRVLYEVGRVDRADEDLRDKVFARVTTDPDANNPFRGAGAQGGLFGADVRDGSDAPLWNPPPRLGGTSFRGRGLINFQNGFLRCVRCIGVVTADGACEPGPGQGLHHADRFADGDYDIDTGACGSNLTGHNAFLETYFPVGALDASRGAVKGPDAIIDTRSVPPGVPIRYTYELPVGNRRGPLRAEARLLFRAFPPFLIRAFAAYEREQARRGLRPTGPLVTESMLARLEVVELARAEVEIP
ncbi:serine/threonine protein kinase [Sorangium sp. So ce176]|uniref:serine/threonine protein kinase n=1 Tax=Sorangium sp. So ce176 TaxID=3133286 RepID=UPI003F62EB41